MVLTRVSLTPPSPSNFHARPQIGMDLLTKDGELGRRCRFANGALRRRTATWLLRGGTWVGTCQVGLGADGGLLRILKEAGLMRPGRKRRPPVWRHQRW